MSWKQHMRFIGITLNQAKSCKSCKSGCSLFGLILDNKFTRNRRKPDWFDPNEKYRPGKWAK
jgi:hypothetical protein